uniref:Uncharacterized protein n=1 Tax=Anopheles culicifacies TaxID=139723 RepID=A0A182MDP6_9DIPT
MEIEQHRFSSNGTSSELHYTPASEQDYGTLSCWGTNEIGTMAEPCIFHLIAAGLPTSVINCSWRNFTNAFEVNCHQGYDGGLKQSFVLEMLSSRYPGHSINLTNTEEPIFSITSFDQLRQQLPAGGHRQPDSLKLYVYSINQKGHSPRIFIADLFIPATLADPAPTQDPKSTLLTPILIGLFLTIVLIIIIIIVRIYLKSKRLKQNINKEKRYTEESKNTLLLVDISKKDKPTKTTKWMNNVGSSIKTKTKVETIDDEQDPDLIPYPRLTDIHQEELIPINSTGSAFAIKQHNAHSPQELEPVDKVDRDKGQDRFYHPANHHHHHPHRQPIISSTTTTYRDEEISEAEINLKGIEDFLMTNRVPESCV